MTNEDTNKLLKEILKWHKLAGREILNKKAKKCFSKREDLLVYSHTDGEKSSRDIAKITNVGYKKIQNLWKTWIKEGIVESSEKYGGGRCIKLFEVSDFEFENDK